MQVSPNHWASYLDRVKEADKIIAEVLNGKPMNANLDTIIHSLIWHRGLCVTRWILSNQELVKRINGLKQPSPGDLALIKLEVEASIKKLTK